jgi:rRNA processing protein Krr1/Pno1
MMQSFRIKSISGKKEKKIPGVNGRLVGQKEQVEQGYK